MFLVQQVWDSERGCYVEEVDHLDVCGCLPQNIRDGLRMRSLGLESEDRAELGETG